MSSAPALAQAAITKAGNRGPRRWTRRGAAPLVTRIEERRSSLKQLIDGAVGMLLSEAVAADGALVFAKACEMGLEGIVSKRAGSLYRSGNGPQWRKCKNPVFGQNVAMPHMPHGSSSCSTSIPIDHVGEYDVRFGQVAEAS
jgi:hypothetical protein